MKTEFSADDTPRRPRWMGEFDAVITVWNIVATAFILRDYIITQKEIHLYMLAGTATISIVYLIMWDKQKTVYEGKSEELFNRAIKQLEIGECYVADGVARYYNGDENKFLAIETEDKWEIWGIDDGTSVKSIEIRNYK